MFLQLDRKPNVNTTYIFEIIFLGSKLIMTHSLSSVGGADIRWSE